MLKRQHLVHTAALGSALVLFLAGILADGRIDRSDLRVVAIGLGVAVVVAAVGRCNRRDLRQQMVPLDHLAEHAERVGFARGFKEGHAQARPVVVQTVCPDCGGPMRKIG